MITQSQQSMLDPDTENVAYINHTFDGYQVTHDVKIVESKPTTIEQSPKLTILCPYCNAPYTARMESEFNYSMGSEWTGIYGEETTIEVYCDNCQKLVYKKSD